MKTTNAHDLSTVEAGHPIHLPGYQGQGGYGAFQADVPGEYSGTARGGCYVLKHPMDMRKGIEALLKFLRARLRWDPPPGRYLFMSKSRTMARILYWDDDKWELRIIKLNRGRFGDFPRGRKELLVPVSPAQFEEFLKVED